MALVSPDHAQALDFKKFAAYDTAGDEEEEYNEDRMFSFSVAKTNEQSEDVTAHPGLVVNPRSIPVIVIMLMCFLF